MTFLPADLHLVVRVNDLIKARTKGAVASTVAGGKYGRIIKLQDMSVWMLEKKHASRIGEILSYYAKHNIPVQYIAPGVKVPRAEVDELGSAARLQSVYVAPTKTEDPEISANAVKIMGKHVVPAVEILKERVENWTQPAKFVYAKDPRFQIELEELIKKRRKLGAGWRAFKKEIDTLREERHRGWKGRIRKVALKMSRAYRTYDEAGQRIRQIKGQAHPTAGGGYDRYTDNDLSMVSVLPHADLGFNPFEKPMSYLLSIGWHKQKSGRVSDPVNVFGKKEADALLYEYGGFISRIVSELVKKYVNAVGIGEYTPGSTWSSKKRPKEYREKFRDWSAYAKAELFLKAKQYVNKGDPSHSNNFACYVHLSLPHDLHRYALEDLGLSAKQGVKEELMADIEAMPEHGGHMATPHTHMETPEQHLQRRELEEAASRIFLDQLTPLEAAVVAARLHFGGGSTEGTYTPKKTSIAVGENLGWRRTKEVVLETLGQFVPDESVRQEAVFKVAKMKEARLADIFDGAMETLRRNSEELDNVDRKILGELARLKSVYLQGLRHEVWGPESFGKLKVVKLKPERTALSQRKHIASKEAAKFWRSELGWQVRSKIGEDLDVMVVPSVTSVAVRRQKLRAREYYKLYVDLSAMTKRKLTNMITAFAQAPESKKIAVPQTHYQALMEAALASKGKGSVAKSFVVLDCELALQELVEECALLNLNLGA